MLDKELCEILEIDEFMQWIMKELDDVEDELNSSRVLGLRGIKLQTKYDTLKEVRDTYHKFNKEEKL